jgi:hypothetical protein
MSSASPNADADAVAVAIRALLLPATGPHLVTLTHGPTPGAIWARHEPVDPDVWHCGIRTVLRALAIGMRGHAGTDPTVYGYALVLSEDQTVCVVTRDGARHVIALGPGAPADSAATAAAMDGLQAMVEAVCDRG